MRRAPTVNEPPYNRLGRIVNCLYGSESTEVAPVCNAGALPTPLSLVRVAFPPVTHGGRWSVLYHSKQFDGMDPSLGGYPTPLDVGYPFEYPAPFLGQPGGGSPFHCPLDAPRDINIDECPRVVTSGDDDPEGPGYIPPEAATAALVHAHDACSPALARWFAHSCRLSASDLLSAIRDIYPRASHPSWKAYPAYSYAPPNQSYPYMADEHRSPAGSPHWCQEGYAKWADFCPYHVNGKYVHAHLIFAAVQQHLAHVHNPSMCSAAWDDSNYPPSPDTSIAFPRMVAAGSNWSTPALPYEWPGPEGVKRKAVRHPFITRLVMQQG